MAKEQGYKGRHAVVENAMPELGGLPGPNPYNSAGGGLDLLFVGRFERQKGLDILLEAFSMARKSNPALTLHVVGASVDEQVELPEHLTAGIHFHGWISATEITSYYAAADMVIMPSRWEGLPMVLIEALRASTPIMLADVSGMGELIEDGRSGIVLPELSTGAFAQALSDLSLERLTTMRPAARELYERRYGPERFRREMRDILTGIAGEGPSDTVAGLLTTDLTP
ncbi:glycosyltransferase family 4 protein [Alloyangia pacifica]|uniref:glycosyltransferase family 4 protein n=1 Tax=Alloyangia pacifica TaxID=311180 RepID=UPI0031D7ECDC